MRNQIKKLALAAIMVAPLSYIACVGSDSNTSENSSQAKTASLHLAINFKNSRPNAQYISNDIQCIKYSIDNGSQWINGTITKDNPQIDLQNVHVGQNYMYLGFYSGDEVDGRCDGDLLSSMHLELNLIEGDNTFNIPFIAYTKWKLENPITFNKLKKDSQETIDSFIINSNMLRYSSGYDAVPASVDETKPAFPQSYHLIWQGSNLYTGNNECANQEDRDKFCFLRYDLQYILQLIGPGGTQIAPNAIESNDLDLEPYTDNNGTKWRRNIFIYGTNPTYEAYQNFDKKLYKLPEDEFSLTQEDGTDVVDELDTVYKTTALNGNQIEGTIIEVATNTSDYFEDYTCAWDPDFKNTFQCPQEIQQEGIKVAVSSALKNQVSAQSKDANDCYMDTRINETRYWVEHSMQYAQCEVEEEGIKAQVATYYSDRCDYNLDGVIDEKDDTNEDGQIDWHDSLPIFVKMHSEGTLNICLYPFTATAEELTPEDKDILIQYGSNRRLY
ncbi:hypothetical protein [Persephonella sp. KM09-Lau-8]|uniref:hypothetical protein n=1 Tax=Persephonella sp. KM09-Lau-8 TaxID=1158345 RepID=UPI0004958B0D|nr:hypothetical protein [Persephonella sp. KM09-Lau-8]